MAKCPHCKSTSFKIEETVPNQSAYKLYFVVCNGCFAPFGAMDYYNVGTVVKTLEKKMDALEASVHQVASNTVTINNNIASIHRIVANIDSKK